MATADPIAIQITDGVDSRIAANILNIAQAALNAFTNVNRLQSALVALGQTTATAALAQLTTAQTTLTTATNTATTAINTQNRALGALGQTSQTTGTTVGTAGQSILGFYRNLAAIVGTGLGIRELIELGDTYTLIQNKLQAVSTSQAQVNELTQRLFELANQTRTPVDEVAKSFVQFDRAMQHLGHSQEDTLRLQRSINEALVVSGASPKAASSALYILSQAFNQNLLNGREFRSLSEHLPIVLDALATSMGKPRSQLKALGSQGKITGEDLVKAFTLIQDKLDTGFAKTIPTVASAFNELRNNLIHAFGEINKSTEFTKTLAQAIVFLANHLGILGVAIGAVGAALAAAFGPSIVAAITEVTLALLANPFVLIATAIGAAASALIIYGDNLKVAEDGQVSLLDVAKGTFGFIKDAISDTFSAVGEQASVVLKYVTGLFGGVGVSWSDVLNKMLSDLKTTSNFIIAIFVALGQTIGVVVADVPAAFELAWKGVTNGAAIAVETIVNSFATGLQVISGLLKDIAPDLAASLNASLESAKIHLPRAQLSTDAKNLGGEIGKIFSESFSKDFLGDAGAAIAKRAHDIAGQRLGVGQATGGSTLRGPGTPDIGEAVDKSIEKRSLFLAKIQGELDKQIASYGLLKAERETQQKLDEIDIQLAAKKLPLLTANEKAHFARDLAIIESQKRVNDEVNKLYESTQGPIDNYNASLEAASVLLLRGKISQEQYEVAVRKSVETYLAATAPLAIYNRALDEQSKLLDINAHSREVQTQLQQLENQLRAKGLQLSPAERDFETQELTNLQHKKELTQALDQIEAQTSGARRNILIQQEAINIAYQKGDITLENYNSRIADTQVALANLNLTTGIGTLQDAALASLGKIREGYTTAAKGMTDAFGTFFSSVADGFANSIGHAIVYGDSLKKALLDVAQQGLSALIGALIKVGIQYVINAAIGNSTLAASTAAQVAAAEVVGLAWAEPAALVSLASFGANAVPATAALAETSALAAALAAVKGFSAGGYTGDMGRSNIAGIVHGQEFVVNASGTSQNRGALEAMNRGQSVGSSRPSIVVEDHTTGGVAFTTAPGLSPNEVRMIAKDVVTTDAAGVVAGDMANPNSRTSKALRDTHNVTRKR